MNGDIYVRDGSRFKKVPNMVGMYYNGIIFTKEQMPDTIGVVVDQKHDHIVICSINPSEIPMTWYDAKDYCEKQFDGKGRMPELSEILLAISFIDDMYRLLWSSTVSDSGYAYYLNSYNSSVYYNNKDYNYHVFAFLDIPIKNIV